jgi:hypothetical protein
LSRLVVALPKVTTTPTLGLAANLFGHFNADCLIL